MQKERDANLASGYRQTFQLRKKVDVHHSDFEISIRVMAQSMTGCSCGHTLSHSESGNMESESYWEREERIRSISRAIRDGSYRVPSRDLAQSLLSRMLDSGCRSKR